MRRKGKAQAQTDDLLQKPGMCSLLCTCTARSINCLPDIRTLCLLLILSFVRRDSSTQTKIAFLEQRRDLFLSIFKGLGSDPYSVVRHVLEEIWLNVWQDPKIKRTIKIGLFGETTIQHVSRMITFFCCQSNGRCSY